MHLILSRAEIKQKAKTNLQSYFGTSILNLILFDLLNIGILQGPLFLGWNEFHKKIYCHDHADVSDQFSGFSLNFWKSLGLWIISTFWISFLTCLFLIPGIIASCAYSQIYRVLLYYPDMPVLEIMARSRQMMKRHKWEYFVLQLSFIGWDLLSLLTFGLLQLYIIPYRSQANFVYFQELKQQKDSENHASNPSLPPYEEPSSCTFQVTNAYHRHSCLFLEGNLKEGIPFYGKALLIVNNGKEDLFSQSIQILDATCDQSAEDTSSSTIMVKLENPEEDIQIGDIVTLEEQ